MIPLTQSNKLIDEGFSLLTADAKKCPNIKWKGLTETPLTKDEFKTAYEKPSTAIVGIVTGYDYLECIDVDLKVFSTAKERVDFWDEYLSFLKDNIYDFDDKFVMYKTASDGFHILYKSKRVQGNTKIAKLKGHKEAVLETRGIGGYIVAYHNNVSEKTYKDIQYISDEDREILWHISRTYDYIEPTPDKAPKVKVKEYDNSGMSPWVDFNQKNSIFAIINEDFNVVRKTSDKFIIKRHGAKSVHSGYVFMGSGCMYLFSTGTIYPAEQLINPFQAYAIKHHNGDFSQAAKELYKDGYGDRIKHKIDIPERKIELPESDLIFPMDIFPDDLKNYLLMCNETLNSSLDYLGSAMLWASSVIIGNSVNIEVKRGWIEVCNLWIALVGKAGIGKTPSISNVTTPLQKVNSREIKNYMNNKQKFDEYSNMSKDEKHLVEEVLTPKKSQFIVNDITLEALIDLHEDSRNCVGVLKDELAGWIKGMNQYRSGADLEHWLSSWNGKEINLNRKTSKSSFVDKAFIPVLGGIQPSILDGFYTEENKDSGFIDRMLFAFPDLHVEKYNDSEIPHEVFNWFNEWLVSFYQSMKNMIVYNDNGEIVPATSKFSPDAKKEWIRIFNEITEKQNSDEENEYLKSMLPKQKSYIPRFALILNLLEAFEKDSKYYEVSAKSVKNAEKLSKYFIAMAKKIKMNSTEMNQFSKVIKKNEDKSDFEIFKEFYEKDNDVNITKLSERMNLSRSTLMRYKKKINGEK